MEQWWEHAACAGTPLDWWFYREHVPPELPRDSQARTNWYEAMTDRARKICATCPVQVECLTAVIAEEAPRPSAKKDRTPRSRRHGFRAGMTPKERARYADQLKATA